MAVVRRLLVTLSLAIAACTTAVDDPDETTSGGPGLECLYDGDCGEQARCHDGTCVLQCEGADCCMLLGECEPPPACDGTRDCHVMTIIRRRQIGRRNPYPGCLR